MVSLYPRVWQSVIAISLLLALLGILVTDSTAPLYLAGLLILLIGIPHGAADHRLFQQLYEKTYGRRSLLLFYLVYLGLMGLVFLGWYLVPQVTLGLFLLLSAYHFGQGNFAYLSERKLTQHLLYLLWGSWVIATPILLHFDEAQPVLSALLGYQVEWSIGLSSFNVSVVGTVGLTGYFLLLGRSLSWRNLWRELVSLAVLGAVFYFSPLFLGFAIYFALWHALPSALDQIRFLFKDENGRSKRRYLLIILPFSALAILSMSSFLLIQPGFAWDAYWSWLFAFIAALTLPHMLLLDRVYERLLSQE